MSTLAATQDALLASLRDEDAPMPAGWGERHAAGLAVYRNNYRSAVVEAIRATFERTEKLVGEGSFRRAAAHHCIVHPPSSWTLDLAGYGFAETCAELFANDPDVAELAALEWAMHVAFTARDTAPFDMVAFAAASAQFDEQDWAELKLEFLPGLAVVKAEHDLVRLWSSLAGEGETPEIERLDAPHYAIVWREGERPVFVLRPLWEGGALIAMQAGVTYGEACAALVEELGEETAIAEAGAMLARWLAEGIVAGIAQ